MKVLMFGMSSYPGGVENYIINYFCHESFPSDRIHLDFVTYETAIAYEKELEEKGYGIYKVPHLKRKPASYYRSVKGIMKNGRYDAVYVNMLTAANMLPVYLARKEGVAKIILHAHASLTIEGAIRKGLHHLNKRYCQRTATIRFACSENAGKWLYGTESFSVIPNAIDCKRYCPSSVYRDKTRKLYDVSDETLLIGHVGRFAREKNHVFMIEVLKAIMSKGIDAKMMLVGDGYTKDKIIQQVEKEGLTERVIFTNTSLQTEKYYPAFDVFLFPSIFEGFGIAALEAQSCGVQCICSDALSQSLNVTGTVKYMSLAEPPSKWADEIRKLHYVDGRKMNEAVQESEFNIENQVSYLVERIKSN